MRPTILITLILLVSNLSLAQENILKKRVTISFKNVELKDALAKLQKKSGVSIAFNNKITSMKTKTTGTFQEKTLEYILHSILRDKSLGYKIIGGQIAIFEKKSEVDIPQNKNSSIRGVVIDEQTKSPLSFINVIIVGTNIGSMTDDKGVFEIENLPSGNYSLKFSAIGYSQVDVDKVELKENQNLNLGTIALQTGATKLSEITVSPGSFSVMGTKKIEKQTLTEKDLKNMSWAEDITRAVTRLPGVASNDFSSKFTVRGGESDEVLMVLDGMELYEPFHQRDFVGGLFSIVDIETIRSVDLLTGGFGAEFGQRQSGVFQMKTKAIADNQNHSSVGFSVMNARVYTDGNFAKNKGKYMVSARRGVIDMALKVAGFDETVPTYYDALTKVEYKLNDKNFLSLHNLYAGDKTEVNDIKPDNYDKHRTKYTNNYTWLTLKSYINKDLFTRTLLYTGYISHDRNGLFHKRDFADKGDFTLTDKRQYWYGGLKQDWTWDISTKHALKTGFDVRGLNADYDYIHSIREVRINQNEEPYIFERNIDVKTKPSGTLFNAYVSGKTLLTQKLIAELGIRYDKATYANDDLFSPRIGLTYSISKITFLRAAYGHYYQSQFINNLDVNHNATKFNKAELSKHYVIGFEHQFKNQVNFRFEGYYKDISRISPMYENLRDPWETFPESRNDVIKLNLENAVSMGVEFFLKYDQGKKLSWWFSYALAKAEDNMKDVEFDGIFQKQTGKLLKPFNQTHTIYADANYRFNKKWHVNLSWQFYHGMPLTKYEYAWQRLPADNELGQETAEIFPDGDLHFYPKHLLYRGDKYPAYHKADVRVNRVFQMKKSKITAFFHLINLYNHFNLRKFDLGATGGDELPVPDGQGGYKISEDHTSWFGITPIFGMSWEF